MTQPRTTRIPTPVYAAAGVGDLALEQLRKLPAVVTELSEKAATGTAELREKAVAGTAELRERAVTINTISTAELREKAALGAAELRVRATAGAAELRERATDALRTANTTATSLRGRAVGAELDPSRLRTAAIRNAAVVVSGAYTATERAAAAYEALVARGARVVGSVGTPGTAPAPADRPATEALDRPATEAPAEVVATPEVLAEKDTLAKAEAVKSARVPAARTTKEPATSTKATAAKATGTKVTAAKSTGTKATAAKSTAAKPAKSNPADDEK